MNVVHVQGVAVRVVEAMWRDVSAVAIRARLLVRGPIPKSRSEKAVWSHEREQRFLYINVKIRPSLVRLRRSY